MPAKKKAKKKAVKKKVALRVKKLKPIAEQHAALLVDIPTAPIVVVALHRSLWERFLDWASGK